MNKWKRIKSQKGSTMIIVCLMMPVLLAFAGLAIDFGNMTMVKNKLQMAADAAALAGVGNISNTSQVISTAKQVAGLNHPGYGTILGTSDISIGSWNVSTSTFTTTSSNPNAVKVTVRRTKATNNAVPLYFMPILGFQTADLTATAIAYSTYPKCTNGCVGTRSITLSSGCNTDCYNSATGSYKSSTATSQGHLACNGNIYLKNGCTVKGNASPGPGSYVYSSGYNYVTGSTTPLSQAVSYPSTAAPSSYNNHGLGSRLKLSSYSSLTLTPDTYYFSSIDLSGNSQLVITGDTKIYVSGDVNISGYGIYNQTQDPTKFSILCTSSTSQVNMWNNSNFYGYVYAPSASVSVSGYGDFYGVCVGRDVSMSGCNLHRDEGVLAINLSPFIKLAN